MSSEIISKQCELFSDSIEGEDIEAIKNIINSMELDYKTQVELRKLIQSLDDELCLDLARTLVKLKENHIIIAGLLFNKIEIWQSEIEYTSNLVITLSKSESWKIREVVISLLYHSLVDTPAEYQSCFSQLAGSKNHFHRRVAISVAKQISRSTQKNLELKKWVYGQVENFLFEKDPFVLVVSIDTFSNGFAKHCPDLFYNSIERLTEQEIDPDCKANFIRTLNCDIDQSYLPRTLDILENFIMEEDIGIKNASYDLLKTLAEKDKGSISSWLEYRMGISNIAEHWARLSIEGYISDNIFNSSSFNDLDF